MRPNTIKNAFEFAESENRPALLSYTVAGDNSKSNSLKIHLNLLSQKIDLRYYLIQLQVIILKVIH